MFSFFSLGLILSFGARFVKSLFSKSEKRDEEILVEARALVIATVLAIAVFFAGKYVEKLQEQAFQTEVRTYINTAQASQEVFHQNYGRYGKTSDEIAFRTETRLYIFFSEEDLPLYLKHMLDKKDWPYATTDDYQFVIEVLRRENENPEILIQPKNGPLRGLEKK